MPWAAKNADDQLGRLIDKLKAKGKFDDTLIVVTADHGSTYGGKAGHGVNALRRRQHNWLVRRQLVRCANTDLTAEHRRRHRRRPGAAERTGKVAFSYQSTAIETLAQAIRSWDKRPMRRGHGDAARASSRPTCEGRRPLHAHLGERHDDARRASLVGAARAGAREHDGVRGLGRRRRPARRQDRLRRLRRPRRRAEGRAAHPDGVLRRASSTATAGRDSAWSTSCRPSFARWASGRRRRWTARPTTCRFRATGARTGTRSERVGAAEWPHPGPFVVRRCGAARVARPQATVTLPADGGPASAAAAAGAVSAGGPRRRRRGCGRATRATAGCSR